MEYATFMDGNLDHISKIQTFWEPYEGNSISANTRNDHEENMRKTWIPRNGTNNNFVFIIRIVFSGL